MAMAPWRFRQAAEAPIPRTFVTDSLGWQASKGVMPALALDKGAKEELFASTDRVFSAQGTLSMDWRRNGGQRC